MVHLKYRFKILPLVGVSICDICHMFYDETQVDLIYCQAHTVVVRCFESNRIFLYSCLDAMTNKHQKRFFTEELFYKHKHSADKIKLEFRALMLNQYLSHLTHVSTLKLSLFGVHPNLDVLFVFKK